MNKISVSLLNSWLYFLQKPDDQARYKQLEDALNGIFTENKWTIRGTEFENQVFAGKHGKLSELVSPLNKQVWCSKILQVDNVKLKLSGKLDALDIEKSRIYDIKRKNEFNEQDFDDSQTTQHLIYFYLNPGIKDFFYLVAAGEDGAAIETHIVHKRRPDTEQELEEKVTKYIHDFFEFLKNNKLYDLYLKKQVTKQNY